VNRDEQQVTGTLQTSVTSGWRVAEGVVVGAVGYTASLLFLLLSMFAVYSIPPLRYILGVYQLDTVFPAFFGVSGGILFAGPLAMWIVRRRKFGSLRQSISWDCSNRVLGWAFLAGFASGTGYSLAKSALLGRGYQPNGPEYIVAFAVLAGIAEPAAEEVYFRGILFAALAGRFGRIPGIAVVTALFCLSHPKHYLAVLPVAVLLGGIRLYTGSVKACFACHAAYNLSLVLFMLPINR